jgi:hypothetical protein
MIVVLNKKLIKVYKSTVQYPGSFDVHNPVLPETKYYNDRANELKLLSLLTINTLHLMNL